MSFLLSFTLSNLFSQTKYVEIIDSNFASQDVIILRKQIRFIQCKDWGNQLIDDTSHLLLADLARFITKEEKKSFEIGFHTDARGSASSNDVHSLKQAKKLIRKILIEKGVDSTRLVARGYGESKPIAVYLSEDSFKLKKPENLPYQLVILNENYINQFKSFNKQKYESLHLLNRRLEIKIVEINE